MRFRQVHLPLGLLVCVLLSCGARLWTSRGADAVPRYAWKDVLARRQRTDNRGNPQHGSAVWSAGRANEYPIIQKKSRPRGNDPNEQTRVLYGREQRTPDMDIWSIGSLRRRRILSSTSDSGTIPTSGTVATAPRDESSSGIGDMGSGILIGFFAALVLVGIAGFVLYPKQTGSDDTTHSIQNLLAPQAPSIRQEEPAVEQAVTCDPGPAKPGEKTASEAAHYNFSTPKLGKEPMDRFDGDSLRCDSTYFAVGQVSMNSASPSLYGNAASPNISSYAFGSLCDLSVGLQRGSTTEDGYSAQNISGNGDPEDLGCVQQLSAAGSWMPNEETADIRLKLEAFSPRQMSKNERPNALDGYVRNVISVFNNSAPTAPSDHSESSQVLPHANINTCYRPPPVLNSTIAKPDRQPSLVYEDIVITPRYSRKDQLSRPTTPLSPSPSRHLAPRSRAGTNTYQSRPSGLLTPAHAEEAIYDIPSQEDSPTRGASARSTRSHSLPSTLHWSKVERTEKGMMAGEQEGRNLEQGALKRNMGTSGSIRPAKPKRLSLSNPEKPPAVLAAISHTMIHDTANSTLHTETAEKNAREKPQPRGRKSIFGIFSQLRRGSTSTEAANEKRNFQDVVKTAIQARADKASVVPTIQARADKASVAPTIPSSIARRTASLPLKTALSVQTSGGSACPKPVLITTSYISQSETPDKDSKAGSEHYQVRRQTLSLPLAPSAKIQSRSLQELRSQKSTEGNIGRAAENNDGDLGRLSGGEWPTSPAHAGDETDADADMYAAVSAEPPLSGSVRRRMAGPLATANADEDEGEEYVAMQFPPQSQPNESLSYAEADLGSTVVQVHSAASPEPDNGEDEYVCMGMSLHTSNPYFTEQR